jgi:hypothetical protein
MGDILIKDGFIATMDRDRTVYKSGDPTCSSTFAESTSS